MLEEPPCESSRDKKISNFLSDRSRQDRLPPHSNKHIPVGKDAFEQEKFELNGRSVVHKNYRQIRRLLHMRLEIGFTPAAKNSIATRRSKGQPGFIVAQWRLEVSRKNRASVPPARTAREQNLGRKAWRRTEKSATEKILPGDGSGTKQRAKREALK
jgi:hypothetical protein